MFLLPDYTALYSSQESLLIFLTTLHTCSLPASVMRLYSETGPCTRIPWAQFPLVRLVNQTMQGSEPMKLGAMPFHLPSKPYITGIPADGLFYLAAYTLLSCLYDFRP